MTVIFFNNFIKKFVESSIRIMGSGIKTNSWILICDSTEAASFESNSGFTWLIFIFIPDFLSKVSWNSWVSIRFKESFEVIKAFRCIVFFEMIYYCWFFLNNLGSLYWFLGLNWCSLLNWFWLSNWLLLSNWGFLLLLNWSWLSSLRNLFLHAWRLWFKWSSFLFHLFYNSCSLELWKINSLINSFRNLLCFDRNSFWVWPATRKTFWEQQLYLNN